MNEKIVNIYEILLENSKQSFVYSIKKQDDSLGFNYYILTKNDSNEPVIYDAGNTIKTLQANKIHLNPVNRDTEKYNLFLKELLIALNNKPKEKPLSRK